MKAGRPSGCLSKSFDCKFDCDACSQVSRPRSACCLRSHPVRPPLPAQKADASGERRPDVRQLLVSCLSADWPIL